ncbi:MAG: ABC transporter permease [Deltaproteobacteria bacterium]|nr:ABC transporter permease [Deltaproteobacteria bacterium]
MLGLAFALQVLRISVPYALAAMGGTLSERSGVVNLALEGMLLGGAFSATVGSFYGGAAAGVVAGAFGGLLVAALYAWVVLRFGADQIVAGVAINLLALGATRYLLKLIFDSASSSPSVPGFDGAGWAGLFIALTALCVVAIHGWLMLTPGGLRLRAVGDQPAAAHSLGVDVLAVRWRAVLAAGVLAGLGGAWLALDNHGFVDRMSGGRGYIAIAAMIFGRWQPLTATAACLLFGLADALQLNLQTTTTLLPREWVQMLPYVLTMVALVGVAGRSRPPAALGTPFGR